MLQKWIKFNFCIEIVIPCIHCRQNTSAFVTKVRNRSQVTWIMISIMISQEPNIIHVFMLITMFIASLWRPHIYIAWSRKRRGKGDDICRGDNLKLGSKSSEVFASLASNSWWFCILNVPLYLLWIEWSLWGTSWVTVFLSWATGCFQNWCAISSETEVGYTPGYPRRLS